MKKLKYIVSFILAGIMALAAGCGCSEDETDAYLIENGKSDYTIIISENCTSKEQTAKDELTLFFKEASGITLETKTDAEAEYSEDAKYISIGKTKFAESLGLIPTYEQVKENGYVIKTAGKSIFLVGFTDFGTLYSVYGFLEREFDYDYYTVDSYSISKVQGNVKLQAYDEVDVPDINMLEENYGYIKANRMVANRYRMMSRTEIFVPINGSATVHNTFDWFPKSKYEAEYGEYFYTPDGTDICFTAHGDAAMFEKMTDFALQEIIEEFKGGQQGTLMIIGQQDIGKTCNCDACERVKEQYSAASAKGILFCNRVLEKVYAWFETEEGAPYKREFYMLLLAYERFVNAPVTKTADGYTINGGLQIHDKFGVMDAPIKNDFTVSRAENEDQFQHYSEWKAASNVYSLYAYDTNYQDYLVPFNTFDSKQDIYQEMKRINCLSLFDHSQSNNYGLASAWSMLKAYLESKLRWDTTIDMNEYTEKYFYGVYGEEVGRIMLDTFWSFRAHWKYLQKEINEGRLDASINGHMASLLNQKVWPLNLLEGWRTNMKSAAEKIEPLKDINPAEYKRLSKMLAAERISVYYLLERLYKNYYSESELLNIRLQFKADARICNINILGPLSKTVSSLITQWGI